MTHQNQTAPEPLEARFFRLDLHGRALRTARACWKSQADVGDERRDVEQDLLAKAWEVYLAHPELPDDRLQRLVSTACARFRTDRQRRVTMQRRKRVDEEADEMLRRVEEPKDEETECES